MSIDPTIFLYIFYGIVNAGMVILTWMAVSYSRHNRKIEREEAMRKMAAEENQR